ncbi:MAG: hypothetical protein JSS79_05345 [Bacteroidetes bacterium]|nr:hypothetical protein [Bacteroidota bacterium]
MKNLQTRFLKITTILSVFSFAVANAQVSKLNKADSLFRAKQYTQSIEIYKGALAERKYSPAMLLKMAYIEEGLGKIGPTLYYLQLYHLASHDDQSLQKMEELASKFNLQGYQNNDASRLSRWFHNGKMLVLAILSALLVLAAFFSYYQRKNQRQPWLAFVCLVLVSVAILYVNNSSPATSVIVSADNTFLMDGPSAGAPVATVIGEGNQLEALGREDVWLKVKWMDKVVFVKENAVLKVAL